DLPADAGRLAVRGRLLGLPAGGPRAAVRPGRLRRLAVGRQPRVGVPTELRGRARRAARVAVRPPGLRRLLLRQLLRGAVPRPRVRPVDGLRRAGLRPAAELLPVVQPREPRLVAEPDGPLRRPAQRLAPGAGDELLPPR